MLKRVLLILLVLFFLGRPVLAAGVEYSLPYPGLLPDSPFYALKVMRDTIVTGVIFDQKQRAFYELFLSDKRLAAAQALLAKKETALAMTTVTKAQDYYSQAVDLAVKVNSQDLTEKLVVSGAKHEDLILEFKTLVTGTNVDKLRLAFDANQKAKNRVLDLLVAK